MDRHEALEILTKLLPAQFQELIFCLEVHDALLSGANAPQKTRAVELYGLLEQNQHRLDRLPIELDRILGGGSSRATQHHARIHNALGSLDFAEQVRTFRGALRAHRTCAFVIHGPPESGHEWLLYRLKRLLRGHSGQAKRIVHACGARGRKPDLNAVLATLRRGFGIDVTAVPVEELARKACETRQTQDLVIVVDGVDKLDDEHVRGLIEQFWGAVLDVAGGDAAGQANGFHLLLFLLHYAEKEAAWSTCCADAATGTWKPRVPIKLPRLASFPASLIADWLDEHVDILPEPLLCPDAAEELFSSCDQGLPWLVFEGICHKWLDDLDEGERAAILAKLDRQWWKLEA